MAIWKNKEVTPYVSRKAEVDFKKINAFSIGRHNDDETEVGYVIEDWEGNRTLDFIYFETDNDSHLALVAKFKDYLDDEDE